MYTLVPMITPRQLLIAQLPAAIALVIAELFYKLGSFTRECVAFLATWIVIDALFRVVTDAWRQGAGEREGGA